PRKARGRAGPQNRLLEPPCKIAEDCGDEPAGGKRMLQGRQQRNWRQPAVSEIEDEPQEDARWGPVQRQTRRIVDLDAPTAELRGNSAGELAVRGDKGGGVSRRLELATQQQCDDHRLLLCARAIEPADPIERISRLRRKAAPCVGSGRRP